MKKSGFLLEFSASSCRLDQRTKKLYLSGMGSRGREIVRVTRVDAGVTVTPYSDLIDREGTELHEIATGLEPGNWHFPEVRFPEERKRSPPDMVAMQTLILSLPSQAGRPTATSPSAQMLASSPLNLSTARG